MKLAKKAFVYIFLLAVGIALFVNIVVHTGIQNIIHSIRDFSLAFFIVYFAIQFLNFLFLTWRWQYILKHSGNFVGYWKLVLHRYSGWAVSFLTPSAQVGGEPVRVMLLCKEGVRRRDAVFSVVVDKVLQLTGLIVFILIGVAILLSRQLVSGSVLWTLILSLSFFVLLLGWFYFATLKNIGFFSSGFRLLRLNRLKRLKKVYNKVLVVEEALQEFYVGHLWKFLGLMFVSVLAEAYEVIGYWLIAYFMGVHLTFAQAFLALILPYLSYLIPIPGALGVFEGGVSAIFAILGVNINAFVFSMIVRVRDLVNVVIGMLNLSGSGIHALRRYFGERFEKGWFRKRYWKLFG